MTVQLAAKGLQDEWLTESPTMSFFETVFTRKSEFRLTTKENPFVNSNIPFGTAQVCQLKKSGDVLRQLILKVILPSTYVSQSYGYSYITPSSQFVPTFKLLDASYTQIAEYSGRQNVFYYTTKNLAWLPSIVSINTDNTFTFTPPYVATYIAFTSTTQAEFWGFRNFVALRNNLYIFPFTGVSETSIAFSGWVNSYYPYFRAYTNNAGLKSFKRIELYIGGQLIESVPQEYILIHNAIMVPEENQRSVTTLGASSFNGVSDKECYIRIPFSCLDPGLPVCALYANDVEVRVEFQDIDQLLDANLTQTFVQYSYDASGLGNVSFADMIDGNRKVFLSGNTLTTWTNGSLIASKNIGSGNVSAFTIGSNVYLNSNEYVYIYNSTSNTVQTIDTKNATVLSPGVGLGTVFNGFINYTATGAFQRVTGPYAETFDVTVGAAPTGLVKTLGTKTYIATQNGFVVHDMYNLTSVVSVPTSPPVSMTLNGASDIYFLTGGGNLSMYRNGAVTSNVAPVTGGKVVESFISNVYVLTGSGGYLYRPVTGTTTTFTDPPAPYAAAATANGIYIATQTGLYMYNGTLSTAFLGTKRFSNVFVGPSGFVYATYAPSTLVQFQDDQQSNFPPSVWRENIISGPTCSFATDLKSNIWTLSDGAAYNKFLDTIAFTESTFTCPPTTDTSEKTIYCDGTSLVAFPKYSGNTAYKYVISSNLLTYYTNPNLAFDCGTTAFINGKVFGFPSITSNVVSYDVSKTFKSDEAFTNESLTFSLGSGFHSAIQVGSNAVVASNTSVLFCSQTSNVSAPSTIGTGGTNLDGYIFPIDFYTSNVLVIDTIKNGLSNVASYPPSLTFSGSISTAVAKYTNDAYYMAPANTSNVYLINPSSNKSTAISTGFPVPNSSNAAVVARDTLYILPDQLNSNIYTIQLATFATGRLPVSPMNASSAAYDGSRYIYAVNGTSTGYRLDTTLDTFTNSDAYSQNPASFTLLPATTKTLTDGSSNILMFAQNSIQQWDGTTFRTFSVPTDSVVPRAKLFNSNTAVLATSSNIIMVSTDTFATFNTYPIYLTGTPVSIEVGLSNIFASFSTGIIGKNDTSSGDINGVGYWSSTPTAFSETPIKSFAIGSNVYTLGPRTVSGITTGTLNGTLLTTNTFSRVQVHRSNAYIFPSTGSRLIRLTSGPDTQTAFQFCSFEDTIGATGTNGNTVYFASRINGNVYAFDTSSTTTSAYTAAGSTGTSGVFSYGSNVYFVGCTTNTLIRYNEQTNNFANAYCGVATNSFVSGTYSLPVYSAGNYIVANQSFVSMAGSGPGQIETVTSKTLLPPSNGYIAANDGTTVYNLTGTSIQTFTFSVPSQVFTSFVTDGTIFVFANTNYIYICLPNGSSMGPVQIDLGNSTIIQSAITITTGSINIPAYKTSSPTQVFIHRFQKNVSGNPPTITTAQRELNNSFLSISTYAFENDGGINVFSFTDSSYTTGTVSGLSTGLFTTGVRVGGYVYLGSSTTSIVARVPDTGISVVDPATYQFFDTSTIITWSPPTLTISSYSSNVIFMSSSSNSFLQYTTTGSFTVGTNWSAGTFASPSTVTRGAVVVGATLKSLATTATQYYSLNGAPVKTEPFTQLNWPIASTFSNASVMNLSDIYIYSGSSSSAVVVFNAANQTFSTGTAYSNVISASAFPYIVHNTSMNTYPLDTQSAPIDVVSDGRYLSIATTGSNVYQFDTVYKRMFVTRGTGGATTLCVENSNVFFANATSVSTYNSAARSYTEYAVASQPPYELVYTNKALFTQIGSGIYRIPETLSSNTLWVTLQTNAVPTDSVLRGTQIIYSTPGLVSNVNTIVAFVSTTQFSAKYGSVIVSSPSQFYSPSTTDGTFWRGTNSVSPSVATTIGATWYRSGNVYAMSSTGNLITYNPSFFSFTSVALPGSTQKVVATPSGTMCYLNFPYVTIGGQNVYSGLLAPITAVYVQDFLLYAMDSIGTYYIINLNTNAVLRRSTGVTGVTSIYPSGSSLYVTNATSTIRIQLSATTLTQLGFTELGTIRDLAFDGRYIYTISNPYIYTIDTQGDTTLFQRFDRNQPTMTPTNGFFDGRFINFTSNTNMLWDLYPFTTPRLKASILAQSAFVSYKESEWMNSRQLDYLVTQIQQASIPSAGYFQVDFLNPVREILCVSNTFSEFELYLNGNLKHQSGPRYMSNASILQYHTRASNTVPVYSLSFSDAPERNAPTGYVNMSRIKEKVVHTNGPMTLYALNFNVLSIRDGLAGLVFNSRFS